MTDSTPDEKDLADEVEATEETIDTGDDAETVEDTADDSTDTSDDADEEETTEVVPAKAARTKKVSTAKKRPAPPVEEYDEEDEYEDDDEDEEPPVRRRPKPARRPAPRKAAASVPADGAKTITTVVVTVVILALLATSITFGVLWGMQKSDNDDAKAAAADRAQAEKVAAGFALRASTIDYRDLAAYQSGVTQGVAPKLKERFAAATPVLDQLLQPMQWVSKSTVLDTVVSSQSGSVYKVNAYVKVETSNVQVPSGREAVSMYTVTMDKDQDWLITDAGSAINTDITQIGGGATAPTEGQAPPAAPAPGN